MRNLVSVVLMSLLAGCATDTGAWSVDHEESNAALLSVLATDYGVYVVGADDGRGPMVMRRVAGAWERLWTGDRGDLWWVAEDADGSVLMAGEDGRILRYEPDRALLESYVTPSAITIFGVWAADDGTAFAVGGDVAAETGRGAIWVRRDDAWERDERVAEAWTDGAVLFKVWGTSASDVWVVGEAGTVLHFDGTAWGQVPVPVSSRLLTVHGGASGPVMVGGSGNGVLLEMDGGEMTDRMPEFMPRANGVFVGDEGAAWVVGDQGTILSRTGDGSWVIDERSPTRLDLHAVTRDLDGNIWAVGGALTSPSFDQGIVLRHGL